MTELIDQLPPDVRVEPGGAYEESVDAGGQMMVSFGLSFVLIVLCLVIQFNGWTKTGPSPDNIANGTRRSLAGPVFVGSLAGPLCRNWESWHCSVSCSIQRSSTSEFADIIIAQRMEQSNANGAIGGMTTVEFSSMSH